MQYRFYYAQIYTNVQRVKFRLEIRLKLITNQGKLQFKQKTETMKQSKKIQDSVGSTFEINFWLGIDDQGSRIKPLIQVT